MTLLDVLTITLFEDKKIEEKLEIVKEKYGDEYCIFIKIIS